VKSSQPLERRPQTTSQWAPGTVVRGRSLRVTELRKSEIHTARVQAWKGKRKVFGW